MQGQRIRFGRVIVLRRNHLNLSYLLERFIQRDDACSLVAVVVGEENFHDAILGCFTSTNDLHLRWRGKVIHKKTAGIACGFFVE